MLSTPTVQTPSFWGKKSQFQHCSQATSLPTATGRQRNLREMGRWEETLIFSWAEVEIPTGMGKPHLPAGRRQREAAVTRLHRWQSRGWAFLGQSCSQPGTAGEAQRGQDTQDRPWPLSSAGHSTALTVPDPHLSTYSIFTPRQGCSKRDILLLWGRWEPPQLSTIPVLPTYPVVALLCAQSLQQGWQELVWDGQQERPRVHNPVAASAAPTSDRQPDGEPGEAAGKGSGKVSHPKPAARCGAALTPRCRSSSTIPGPREPIKPPRRRAGGQPRPG